jgi:hypothetical protein
MDVRGRVLVWRTDLTLRRANHHRRAVLRRELAAYSTPAELADLDAMVDRYPPEQTREVRSLLAAQRFPMSWSHMHSAG